MPDGAVRVTLPPVQKESGPDAVMTGVAALLTVTTVGADVPLQPSGAVTVTVYEPAVVTTMDGEVAPLDHKYDVMPASAVSVTLPPEQKVVGPAGVIEAAGGVLTLTTVGADVAVQPASVTLTVSVSVAEITTDCVVAPFDHSQEVPLIAVSVTLPPVQKVVGPEATTVGSGGAVTVTAIGVEVALQPLESVMVTV